MSSESSIISRRGAIGAAAGAVVASAFVGPTRAQAATPTVMPAPKAPSISQGELDAGVVVASPSRFPGIDPTGASDSSGGLQAAINATPEGSQLIIPAGTYSVGSEIYPKLGKSIRISGYGATLLQTTSRPVFGLSGTYESPIQVSGIVNAPAAGASSPVSSLSLASAPSWRPGDVVKIVSDDVIEGARPGDGILESRRGEFSIVRSVSGTTVQLNGALLDAYSSNVRVSRIPSQSIYLEGMTFRTADSRMTTVNSALVLLARLMNPVVRDVKVIRANGPAFQFVSCYGYVVEDCEVGLATDATATGIFGYGVLDNASAFGKVRGGIYRHVRHAYTDDTNRVAAGSDLGAYGRTLGTKVIGVHAHMTTNAAFDTHHCSRSVEFIGCTAVGGANIGSGQCGFQLRGVGHVVTDGTVLNCDTGLQVITETRGGESWAHVVNGLRVVNAPSAAVRVHVRPSGHPRALQRDERTNVQISELNATDCGSFITALNARVDISRSYFGAPAGRSGTDVRGVYGSNSILRLYATVIDFEGNTAGTPRVASSGLTSGSAPGDQQTHLIDCEIRANQSVTSRAWGAVNGPRHILRARDLRFTHPFRYMPGENLDAASEYTWYCDSRDVPRPMPSSSTFVLANGDWQAHLTRSVLSADAALFLSIITTNAVTASEFPAGSIPGQVMTLAHQGSRTWTVPHGGTSRVRLSGNAPLALQAGDVIRLTWIGSSWVQS